MSTSKMITNATLKGKSLNLKQTNYQAGIKEVYCSDFLASSNLLATGEWNNSESTNAMVVFTDLGTGEFKGKY